MPFKSLMKNPILAIGILMMFIFLATAGPKLGWWESRTDKLRPTSCKAVIVKLERRIPANWQTGCEGPRRTNLYVTINEAENSNIQNNLEKQYIYRLLANHMISIAKNSPVDNLERTPYVRIRLHYRERVINALTEGRFIIKLATLTDPKLIAEHLKVTVQIQEAGK